VTCERCGEREATIEYVDIVEGQKTQVWLCESCALAEGVAGTVDEDDETSAGADALSQFVGGLLAAKETDAPASAEEPEICPECGFSTDQLEAQGVVGCPACYGAFRARVLPLLERYHRGRSHVGKTPRADGPRAALRRELADLRTSLERAVSAESYEEAARLRDRIREREHELARLAVAERDPTAGPAPGSAGSDRDTGTESEAGPEENPRS
jgi:protein arginine kinase activator